MSEASGVTVSCSALSDTRFDALARICGLADADHARGKMLRLWNQCLREQSYVVTVEDAEAMLGANAVDGLTRARLGEVVDGGIRIRGTKGRIEWLGERKEQSASAGRARSAGARRDAKGRMLPSVSHTVFAENPAVAGSAGPALASTSPAESSPSSSSSSLSEKKIPEVPSAPPPALELSVQETRIEPKPKPRDRPTGDHQRVIDAFWTAFEKAHGVKPTYTADVGAHAKRLLTSHSADEVVRRLENFFARPRHQWPESRDWGTFVKHFDKWAVSSVPAFVPPAYEPMPRRSKAL